MAVPREKLGLRSREWTATVDMEQAQAYAAATNDDNPAYRDGTCAPPVFGVVPTWDAIVATVGDVVPPESLPSILHAAHDMWFHRPLVPAMTLHTRAEPHSLRTARSGARVTIRVTSRDDSGRPALEQYATLFVRGMTGGDDFGADPPGHALGRAKRSGPGTEVRLHVDDDQTYRYRDASGDRMPIHVDEEAARAVGLPGIIVHGLCTMAMCSQAVVKTVAAGDPTRLRRLAVRFSRPVFPGHDVVTTIYDVDGGRDARTYAFEARSQGSLVIKDGLAELDG